jgi:hypothetical protein
VVGVGFSKVLPRGHGDQVRATYDYPVVTLLPHIEGALEQPRIAVPIRCSFILLYADFTPCVIFIRGTRLGCVQVDQGSVRGRVRRYMMRDGLSSRSRSRRRSRSRFVG